MELLKDLSPEEHDLVYQAVKVILIGVRSSFKPKNN